MLGLRVFDFTLLILLFVLVLFCGLVFSVVGFSGFPSYYDELVYVGCGVEYVVNFTPPINCNFEHPPLGKYLIGFAVLIGLGNALYLFLVVGSSLLVYFLVRDLLGSGLLGFFAGFLLVLDTVFLNTHRFLLLDPPAIFFLLLSLYFVFSRSSALISGFFFGLGVACKFSVVPYFLVFLYVFVVRWGLTKRFFRGLLVFVCVSLVSYLSTYVADLVLGPYAVVQHHVAMFSYMFWRHGFSLPVALNGLLKLISKVEVWRYGGGFTFTFAGNANTTMFLVGSEFIPGSGSLVILGLGLGSVFWYVMLPSLMINTYRVLTRKPGFSEVFACVAGWVSLTTILPGPLDWYYVNALPLLYANVALLIKNLTRNREDILKYLVPGLVGVQSLITLLTLTGLIPYRISFPLP